MLRILKRARVMREPKFLLLFYEFYLQLEVNCHTEGQTLQSALQDLAPAQDIRKPSLYHEQYISCGHFQNHHLEQVHQLSDLRIFSVTTNGFNQTRSTTLQIIPSSKRDDTTSLTFNLVDEMGKSVISASH
jgi:hypothetical protein